MRLLFVADGRSPIALNWIEYFVETGHEVHLVSTYPCNPDIRLTSLVVLPVAFGAAGDQKDYPAAISSKSPPYPILGVEGKQKNGGDDTVRLSFTMPSPPKKSILREVLPVGLRTVIRQRLGPSTLPSASRRLQLLFSYIQPDLVHAMRIPYEGMLAALAEPHCPLLVSVWGNDFTLHAPSTRQMAKFTRQTLQRANALHTDCERDRRLAFTWGFPSQLPAVTLPGAGGIQLDLFKFNSEKTSDAQSAPLIINPRGVRAYVRNDTFFQAIPLVLEHAPQTRFVCPGMVGQTEMMHWIEKFDISRSVTLLPRTSRTDMANLFKKADIAVSITEHDGTPNTLLEAMASGCFPIAGDIETLREWITPGVNGLLVPPGDAQALADAIVTALEHPELREKAREINLKIIKERADYTKMMPQALDFYQSLINENFYKEGRKARE